MKNIYDNMEIDTQFNLIKSKVNEKDLRAYIYQCIYDPEKNQICSQEVKNLEILTNEQIRNWNDGIDLQLLNFEQLKQLSNCLGLEYPNYMYYFNPINGFDTNDYRTYPQIFDSIESVCTDKNGLIVLYSGISCAYFLFSSNGIELLRSSYSIKIGINGLIQCDDNTADEIKTASETAVNWDKLNSSYQVELYENIEANFPDIKGRDKIFENDLTESGYKKTELKQLIDEIVAKKILEADGCLIRYMSKQFQENEELAFTACVQNKLAYSLLPVKIQKDTGFIARLLDCDDVDVNIRNFIYFEQIPIDSNLAESTRMKKPLLPSWSPLIIDRFDSISPNLSKKVPDYFELLAYLYQMTNSDFVFAEPLTKKYSELLNNKPVEEILLDTELKQEIEDNLWKEGCYPQDIYIFNQRKTIPKVDFKSYPTIYTGILDITFDKGGLLVMESFCDQINSLHDIAGDILLWECSDIIFGMDGLIAYRYCNDLSGFWTFERYENGRLNPYGPSSENYIAYDYNLNGYPFIHSRDRIPLMKGWEDPYCQPLLINLLWKRKIITDILKNDGCLIRYTQDWVKEDEEFALLACQKEIAFTLISPKLQHDKSFVLKLYSMPNIDVNLYSFLNAELRADKDILQLKSDKTRIEEENQKYMRTLYGEDELPF